MSYKKPYRFLFGPVSSRRMGASLGIDLLPPKTCSLDCLYCEVGPTTVHTRQRFNLNQGEAILSELEAYLTDPASPALDYITLAGSGEPTLNAELGWLLRQIKAITPTPVAVLTNSTLMVDPAVRQELGAADLVAPSLDTAVEETFIRLNRPAPGVTAAAMIESLAQFRAEYAGRLWLEVLLVKDFNDSLAELEALKKAVDKINPDQLQLNTVFRPPAYAIAQALAPERLDLAAKFLGGGLGQVKPAEPATGLGEAGKKEAILSLVARRPCPVDEIAAALNTTSQQLADTLVKMESAGQITSKIHHGQRYYCLTS